MMANAVAHRLLHTMFRVDDLDRSIAFYTNILGMIELRREEFPEAAFTLSFLGYGGEDTHCVLELTKNHDPQAYQNGTRFGHFAVAVLDIYAAIKRCKSLGVKVTREAGPMAFASKSGQRDLIAFIEDPDGHQIELIERS